MAGKLRDALHLRVSQWGIALCLTVISLGLASILTLRQLALASAQARDLRLEGLASLEAHEKLEAEMLNNRQQFLHLLVEPGGADALSQVAGIRQNDLYVSLLAGQAAFRGAAKPILNEFLTNWETYNEVRDDAIALALAGRAEEALRLEAASGAQAFASADVSIQKAGSALDGAALGMVSSMSRTLHSALLELAGLLSAALFSAVLFIGLDLRHRKTLSRLRNAEQDAHATRETLDLAQRAAHVSFLEWDPRKGEVSCAPEELGLPPVPEGRVRMRVEEFRRYVHEEDFGRLLRTLEGALRQKTDYEVEYRVVRPGGETRWLLNRGRAVEEQGGKSIVVGAGMDVTENRRAVQALRHSEERFRKAFEDSGVGMCLISTVGLLIAMNRAAEIITGYTEAELRGRYADEILAPEYKDDARHAMADLCAGGTKPYQAERRLIRKDGSSVWVRNSVSALFRDGKPDHLFAVMEDISERREAIEKLGWQATHDPLTGLANRLEIETRLKGMVAQALAEEQLGRTLRFALLYFDLDGFKLINDSLGHTAGDALLRQVADLLNRLRGDSAVAGRLGGDEFAIICDADDEGAVRLCESVLEAMRAPFRIGGHELHLGASAGIAVYPRDGVNAEELLKNADTAMYESKRQGRSRYSAFTPELRERGHWELRVRNNLGRALEFGELSLAFQPQYSIEDRRLVRFEALCRWRNAELGDVSPAHFIPIAEECGLIVPLGEWVLREACREARSWQGSGMGTQVAVNVSAVQFNRPDFVASVMAILSETGLEPGMLELELTESATLRDLSEGIIRVAQLRAIGISVSLDDFGTGYSSLSYLQQLGVDRVKIDQSFISGIEFHSSSVSMVRSVVAMARELGLHVTVEGVETASQLEILRELGCEEAQGYFLGRPESPERARERLRHEFLCAPDPEPVMVPH